MGAVEQEKKGVDSSLSPLLSTSRSILAIHGRVDDWRRSVCLLLLLLIHGGGGDNQRPTTFVIVETLGEGLGWLRS